MPTRPDKPHKRPATPHNNPRALLQREHPRDTRRRDLSPCECPTTPSPLHTHKALHNPANATITPHNTGCTTSTRSNPGCPRSPLNTPPRDHSHTSPPNRPLTDSPNNPQTPHTHQATPPPSQPTAHPAPQTQTPHHQPQPHQHPQPHHAPHQHPKTKKTTRTRTTTKRKSPPPTHPDPQPPPQHPQPTPPHDPQTPAGQPTPNQHPTTPHPHQPPQTTPPTGPPAHPTHQHHDPTPPTAQHHHHPTHQHHQHQTPQAPLNRHPTTRQPLPHSPIPHTHPNPRHPSLNRRINTRRLHQNHLGFRPTNPKRRHPRPTQPPTKPTPPHNLIHQQRHPTQTPIHMTRRSINMQRPRQQPPPQRHHHLNHTRNTSRRLRMTNIRLHRPQPQRATNTTPTIRPQQRTSLNRITQHRTRPMPLNHIHITHTQPRIPQRRQNHPLLSRTIRRRQPITSPILIHRTTTHHPQHTMPISPRINQPLQHHHTHTLRKPSPISPIRKRLTPPINRQPPLTTQLNKHTRRRQHSHPTSQHQRTLPTTQRPTPQMQRHQRRRTRSINRHRRPLQPQTISHTTRHHTTRITNTDIPFKLTRHTPQTRRVIVIHHTREHPSITTPQRQRVNTSIFNRLPRHFQQQPLLRIHRQRLTTTNPKKPSIKISRIKQKPTLTHITSTQTIRVRVKQPIQIPTPIHRKPRNRIPTPNNKLPQPLSRTHTTRKTTTHTHNRNHILIARFQFAHPRTRPLQL